MIMKGKELHTTAQTGRNSTKKLGYVGEHDHQAKRVYDETGKLPALNVVCNSLVKLGHIGNTDAQANRVYDSEGKSVTLSANGGGLGAKTGLYYVGHLEGIVRKGMEGQEGLSRAHPQCDRVYSPDGKAPTLAASETSGRTHVWIPTPYELHVPEGKSTSDVRVGQEQRRKLKNGKRADNDPNVEAQRRIETRNDDKCGTLTTVQKDNHVVDVPQARIRKLTPVECERLQGLPDGYTEGIAKTNRYKSLGNAFNVDVVRHILSFVPRD
jgi:site-specific DNA-cytosine methylase